MHSHNTPKERIPCVKVIAEERKKKSTFKQFGMNTAEWMIGGGIVMENEKGGERMAVDRNKYG